MPDGRPDRGAARGQLPARDPVARPLLPDDLVDGDRRPRSPRRRLPARDVRDGLQLLGIAHRDELPAQLLHPVLEAEPLGGADHARLVHEDHEAARRRQVAPRPPRFPGGDRRGLHPSYPAKFLDRLSGLRGSYHLVAPRLPDPRRLGDRERLAGAGMPLDKGEPLRRKHRLRGRPLAGVEVLRKRLRARQGSVDLQPLFRKPPSRRREALLRSRPRGSHELRRPVRRRPVQFDKLRMRHRPVAERVDLRVRKGFPEPGEKRLPDIGFREHGLLALHDHEYVLGIPDQELPVAFPDLGGAVLLAGRRTARLGMRGDMRIVALRLQHDAPVEVGAVVDPRRVAFPGERGVGMGRPGLAPLLEQGPGIPVPRLSAPAVRLQRPQRQHHMGVGIAVTLVVDHPVSDHAAAREGVRDEVPHQRDLRFMVELGGQRDRQGAGELGFPGELVQARFRVLDVVPEQLGQPRPHRCGVACAARFRTMLGRRFPPSSDTVAFRNPSEAIRIGPAAVGTARAACQGRTVPDARSRLRHRGTA